jgi:hypothetical protein
VPQLRAADGLSKESCENFVRSFREMGPEEDCRRRPAAEGKGNRGLHLALGSRGRRWSAGCPSWVDYPAENRVASPSRVASIRSSRHNLPAEFAAGKPCQMGVSPC